MTKPPDVVDPDVDDAPAPNAETREARTGATRHTGDGDSAEPVQLEGFCIDHFKVRRLLGVGGMGEVYLARDMRLGRKVAIKTVRLSRLKNPKATKRFLFEAQATAKFSHPHIINIYTVGEYEGRPYVALEYLDGQNLRQRLTERRLGPQEAIRLALPIAEALAEAHRRGILHRDLKPANIMLPRDGRLRVVDFGIAQVLKSPVSTEEGNHDSEPPILLEGLGNTQPRFAGTPRYMSPEQWASEDCTGASDVWALGVVMFEMCAGARPFTGDSVHRLAAAVRSDRLAPSLHDRAEVPAKLASLVARCLEKDPTNRPTASEVAAELRELLGSGTARLVDSESPFRGLLPFTERHADMFFGRDAEVATFLERIRLQPVLPVVGPSGAGKSSFIQAGVIPRLREQNRWTVLSVRPGQHPLHALARRLVRAESYSHSVSNTGGQSGIPTAGRHERSTADSEPRSDEIPAPRSSEESVAAVEALAAQLLEAPTQLALQLMDLAETQRANVLLFVDQLEELFTLCEDQEVRNAFIEAICSAADEADDPVRVVFGVRDDYLGRLATSAVAQRSLSQVTVIRELDGDALAEVLTNPLEAVGYSFESPQTVTAMVDDVRGERACLPLLQFAAQRLWEHRDEGKQQLTAHSFERMGGVAGALARHAGAVLDGLTPAELNQARELLLRLVTPERTRRSLTKKAALAGLDKSARAVLGRLTEARLVTVVKTRGAGSMIELAHESLVHTWATLRDWLDESRVERAVLGDAEEAAALWARRGRRDGELWQGDALREALPALERIPTMPELVGEFVSDSRRAEQRRGRRRRMVRGAALVVLIALAASATTVALIIAEKERAAQTGRKAAQHHRAEGAVEGATRAFEAGHMLEARAKLRGALEIEDSTAARALWWQLRNTPTWIRRPLHGVTYSLEFAPDGSTFAVARGDTTVGLFDALSGAHRSLRGHHDQVLAVTYSADGKWIASGSWGGGVRLWRASDGHVVAAFRAHKGALRSLAIDPKGKLLASSGGESKIRLWALPSGQAQGELSGHEGAVPSVDFSPDGTLLASGGSDKSVRLWRIRDRVEVAKLQGHRHGIWRLAFSAKGRRLASGDNDGSVRIWDVAKRSAIKVLNDQKSGIRGLRFTKSVLASGAYDGRVILYDEDGNKPRSVMTDGALRDIDLSPDGKSLVAGGGVAGFHVVDLRVTPAPVPAARNTSPIFGLAFSPDDRFVLSKSMTELRRWNTRTGSFEILRSGKEHGNVAVAVRSDGMVAAGGAGNIVELYAADQFSEPSARLAGHQAAVRGLAFSPDGTLLASGDNAGEVILWDPVQKKRLAVLKHPGGSVHHLSFSSDGKWLGVSHSSTGAHVWDVASRERKIGGEAHSQAFAACFSPDSSTLVSSGGDQMVRFRDVASGQQRDTFLLPARAYGVDFDRSGRRVVLPGSDAAVRLLDIETKELKVLRGHWLEVNDARFSHSGRWVASAGDAGVVRLWDVESQTALWRAPLLLEGPPRLLTAHSFTALADSSTATWPYGPALRKALTRRASYAVLSGKDAMCVRDPDGVFLWSMASDRVVFEKRDADVAQVEAFDGACVWRSGDKLMMASAAAEIPLQVEGVASAVHAARGRLLVAAGETLHILAKDGRKVTSYPIDAGATQVGLVDGGSLDDGNRSSRVLPSAVVLGFSDGTMAWRAKGGASNVLANTGTRSPLTRIASGMRRTIATGHASGQVTLIDRENGAVLRSERLTGRVLHLTIEAGRLYAASDLGASLVWDLRDLDREYCEILAELWRRVPVVWDQRRAKRQASPKSHACVP